MYIAQSLILSGNIAYLNITDCDIVANTIHSFDKVVPLSVVAVGRASAGKETNSLLLNRGRGILPTRNAPVVFIYDGRELLYKFDMSSNKSTTSMR